jgi:hypothetical protein
VLQIPYGSQTALVRVGPAIALPGRWEIYATDNANEHYSVWLIYKPRARLSDTAVFLLSGEPIALVSPGRDSEKAFYEFGVDRVAAKAIAARFGVAPHDRAPIGESVAGRFAPIERVYRSGDPVEIELAIENPATAPPVGIQVGGRQRGPRDNRFELTVYCDGQPLPPLPGPDFGGPTHFAPMAPGSAVRLRACVERWADVSKPGHYRVECRYATTFAPSGINPWTPGNAARVWDRVFTGAVEFDVELKPT